MNLPDSFQEKVVNYIISADAARVQIARQNFDARLLFTKPYEIDTMDCQQYVILNKN
jgi:hypothetical protein